MVLMCSIQKFSCSEKIPITSYDGYMYEFNIKGYNISNRNKENGKFKHRMEF